MTGKVVAEEDGSALDGAMIWLDGGLVFGPTGVDGRFSIRDIPATSFRLDARRIGFAPQVVHVPPARDTVVIRMALDPVALRSAEVHGSREGKRGPEEPISGVEHVTLRRIENEIGAGGDVLRSLQTLPSVAVANDFSSQLYIRGGGPEQNAVLLDGVPVYLPYRALSALSAFNPLLIESADLYPGGFGAQYGDRLSAVLDIGYRRGSNTEARREIAANAIMTHALAEGPLGSGGASYILSARRTHYDLIVNRRGAEASVAYPSFTDAYGKISGRVGRGLYDLFGWYGTESMNLTQTSKASDRRSFDAELGEQFYSGAVGLNLRLSATPRAVHTMTIAVSLDDRAMNLGGDFAATYDETHRLAMAQARSLLQPSKDLVIIAGVGTYQTRTQSDYLAQGLHDEGNEERPPDGYDYRPAQPAFAYNHRATKVFAYAQAEFALSPRWQWTIGGRADKNFSFAGSDFSPRTSLSVRLADGWTLRGAYGWYYQSPAPEAFVERNYFPDLGGHPELRPEKAVHYVVALKNSIGEQGSVEVDGYYKQLSDLLCDRADGSFAPFNGGRGEAWGVEVYARLSDLPERRLSGELSSALARTFVETPYDSYVLRYDQRHTLSLSGHYRLGRGWRLGAKCRWGSGFPFTDVVDRKAGVSNPTETPWVPVWGPTNGARYPDYGRFDLRLTRELRWGRTAWEVYVEVLNVLNRENVFRYEWDREYLTRHARYQLPRLPNVGLSVKF